MDTSFNLKHKLENTTPMTKNVNINHQIMKIKTRVNRPKLAKETSSGSIGLFSRTSPTTSVNISFF